jgi:hypothetical protein
MNWTDLSKIIWFCGIIRLHSNSVGALRHVFIVSHFYQIYFSVLGSYLNLDCGMRNHEVRISDPMLAPMSMSDVIQAHFRHIQKNIVKAYFFIIIYIGLTLILETIDFTCLIILRNDVDLTWFFKTILITR